MRLLGPPVSIPSLCVHALLNIVIFPQGSCVYERKEKGRAISDNTNPHLFPVEKTGANLSERQGAKAGSWLVTFNCMLLKSVLNKKRNGVYFLIYDV